MKNWIKVLIGLFTLSSCNSGTKNLTEREFTQIYLDEFRKVQPNVDFQIVDDLKVAATINEKTLQHFLDNAYIEYKSQPDSLYVVINRYINSSLELYIEKPSIQIERIIPVIKPIDYLDDLRRLSKESGEEKEPWVVYEKYNDQLIIVFGEDTENSIAYFNEEEFNTLGINKDTLLVFSINNLKNILPDIQKVGEKDFFGLMAGGVYEASLILLTTLWSKENFDIKGDFVISIPNRDILFITGSGNLEEIEKVKELTANSYQNGNYSISPYLYKWNGNKFEEYK
jgi:uncharacterized protein YtpQ (UPF0354 family)